MVVFNFKSLLILNLRFHVRMLEKENVAFFFKIIKKLFKNKS